MPSSKMNKSVLVTGAVLSLASQALGHMEMSWPYPLHSKYNPANSYNVIDYSMTSPLVADGSNFPCKGYQNDRPFTPVITYSAGSSYNMTLAGSASHGGGSCQLSLSYDNGATFRVIKSMIGGCPLTSTYDFTIPSYAPNGDALFAWTWQNEQGNREFYMNCAQVAITGSSASKKRDTSTFEALPFIWKANIAGINTCTTTEGEDPVYPQPGPDVQYGGSMSSSSSASTKAGVCDAATPFGQTYKDLGDTAEPQTATVGGGSAATTVKTSSKSSAAASSSKVPTTLQSTTKTSAASSSTKASSSAQSSAANTVKSSSSNTASTVVTFSSVNAGKTKSSSTTSAPSSSATSDDDDCPSDVTLTVYTTSGATSKTSVISNSASATTSSSGSSSTAPTDPDTEYATGDLSTYLPCVPGTYICTSVSTWVTCDTTMYSDGSTSWVYRDARTLSNGAHCVPSFSPYSSSTKAYAQQADSPAGFYRDDRIAYSTGNSCSENGDVQCVGTGAFDMCADNVWYNMGAVASGTTCSNGALVAGS